MPRDRGNESSQDLTVRDSCPVYGEDDYLMIDDPRDQIVGYVHFGDSYAAGMGTGTTTSDACRVDENKYGKVLYNFWKDDKISFESKVCSGDTTKGSNRQIDEWKDPQKAKVGTVSMGGINIGFYDLIQNCIITPWTTHPGSWYRG